MREHIKAARAPLAAVENKIGDDVARAEGLLEHLSGKHAPIARQGHIGRFEGQEIWRDLGQNQSLARGRG